MTSARFKRVVSRHDCGKSQSAGAKQASKNVAADWLDMRADSSDFLYLATITGCWYWGYMAVCFLGHATQDW
jgi:hypothetical protein